MSPVSITVLNLAAGVWTALGQAAQRHNLQIVADQAIDVRVLDAPAGNVVGQYLGIVLPLSLVIDEGREVELRHGAGGANAMGTWTTDEAT